MTTESRSCSFKIRTKENNISLVPKPRPMGWDTAVPEETVFGIVSRHHKLSGNLFSHETQSELTDCSYACLSTSFPNNFPKIVSRIDLPLSSVGELINFHTILPYFNIFWDQAKYKEIFQNLATGLGTMAKDSLGPSSMGLCAKRLLRFCPECGNEDREILGAPTWYRVHQLPGVLLCPYHGIPLKIHAFSICRNGRRLFLPDSSMSNKDCISQMSECANEKLMIIARLSAELLRMKSTEIPPMLLQNNYLSHLYDRGLVTRKKCIRGTELKDEFLKFWFDLTEVAPFSYLLSSCHQRKCWLTYLYQKPRSSHHPLKHLLLIGFLADSVNTFMSGSTLTAVDSFRNLSQPAENPIEEQIRTLHGEGKTATQISKQIGLAVNTVITRGARIGISFKKTPRKVNADVYCQVRSALTAGEPIKQIMRAMNLSRSTVSGLLRSDPELQSQRLFNISEKRRSFSREKVLFAIRNQEVTTFKNFRSIGGRDYIWLYKYDRQWLMHQARLVGLDPSRKSSIDWSKRDLILLGEVEAAIEEILSSSHIPVPLNRSEIACRTNHESWLRFPCAKLQNTNALIKQVTETKEAFKQRCQAVLAKKQGFCLRPVELRH